MATWHQTRGGMLGVYDRHETMWKVLENPPNQGCAIGLYTLESEARANKAGLELHHPHLRGHVHVIPPKG